MRNLKKLILSLFIVGLGAVAVPSVVKAADATTLTLSNNNGAIDWSLNGTTLDSNDITSIELKTGSGQTATITTNSATSGTYSKMDTLALATSGASGAVINQTITGQAKTASTGTLDSNSLSLSAIYKMTVSGDTGASYTATPTYGYEGDSCELKATISDLNTHYLQKWSNGTNEIATNPATVNFASTEAQNTYTASLKKKVTSITADFPSSMQVGETAVVTPVVNPTDSWSATDITWSISLPTGTGGATWTTDANGKLLLTATVAGKVRMTATVANGEGIGTAKTQTFDITITNKAVTSITITSPNSTPVSTPLTLVATVLPNDATDKSVTWKVPAGNSVGATITDGKLTATNTGTVEVTATSVSTPAVSATQTVTITSIVPVTGITGVPTDITVGYELALAGSNYPTVSPTTATNKTITWSVKTANSTGAAISGSTFKATSAGTAVVTATIANGTSTGNYTQDFTINVYKAPTISYDSGNRTLSVSLPDKVVTGYGNSSNITEVTGGYLEVYYNGSSVYNSGTSYQSSGKSFTISASSVESIIESLSSKFSGTTATVEFRLTPMGRTASNTSGYERSSINATTGSVTVYEVVVAGTNIVTKTYYGLSGSSLKITATPASGCTFSQWADGSTTNPRTITVSSTTSSNGYSATGVLGVNRSSTTAAGTGSGGTGSGSGYDAVPKTGEGNAVLFMLIIAVLSGAAAAVVLVKRISKTKV